MSPVSRFVALALFVVLMALTAMLALPVWHEAQRRGVGERTTAAPAASHPAGRAPGLAQRFTLGLAVAGTALSLTLLLGGALRPPRPGEAVRPGHRAPDLTVLAQLAQSSAAQGVELTRERDVRRRAEEDAQLKQQLLTQSLEEKIRLGQDLHDGIIQSLYATGLTLETVRALVRTNPDEAERRIEEARSGLNGTLREVRSYITGLAPDRLRRAGFARALTALLNELRAGRPAEFEITVDEEAAAVLTPEQHLEVLQIAREAVSNALRHGAATRVAVRMHRGDREVGLLVQDNGRGFDPKRAAGGGHGLANMEARAARIGGTLRVASEAGLGTRVITTVPVPSDPAA